MIHTERHLFSIHELILSGKKSLSYFQWPTCWYSIANHLA